LGGSPRHIAHRRHFIVITSVFSTADQFEFEFVGSFSESAASYYTLRFCWYRTLYLIARWASEMGGTLQGRVAEAPL
jgi:hypothetical protein